MSVEQTVNHQPSSNCSAFDLSMLSSTLSCFDNNFNYISPGVYKPNQQKGEHPLADKRQFYSELAAKTAVEITGSYQGWTAFLTTAARLYKYPYHEQLLIFAQRPDATACADYDLWNNQMRRYVRRGSKGIALIDTTGDNPRLKYVFDVADTGGRENALTPYLWEYREDEHYAAVSAALSNRFDSDIEENLPRQLQRISIALAEDYWNEHQRDILDIVDGSYLEGYDEYNIGAAFQSAEAVSTSYTHLSRCGIDPESIFTHEDFLSVFDFNTTDTVAALGTSVSQNSEQVLRHIEITIKNYERERMQSHDRTDLQQERRLSDSRSEPDQTGEQAPGQVREDAEEVPEGAAPDPVEPPGPERVPDPAPAGDRRDGEPEAGSADAPVDGESGRNGGAESQRPNDLGGSDEQLQSPGRGDDPDRADLQLNDQPAIVAAEQFSLFPSEAEQIAVTQVAESVSTDAPFAFSVSQDVIDEFLRQGSNVSNSRMRIVAEFSKGKSLTEQGEFLRSQYVGGYGLRTDGADFSAWYADDGIHVAPGKGAQYKASAQVIPWADAAQRVNELLDAGDFTTNVEVVESSGLERLEIARELWYLHSDLSETAVEAGYLALFTGNGFAADTEGIADTLRFPEFAQSVAAELQRFHDAYTQNPSLMRFHYHHPGDLLARVRELPLERKEYASELSELPATQGFITEDEINGVLVGGSHVEGSEGRIYGFYQGEHTPKEKTDFLKQEYGIGGAVPGILREDHTHESHDSKGIKLEKPNCETVTLTWTNVSKRIEALISQRRYLSPEAIRAWETRQQNTAELTAIAAEYNRIKEAHPDDIVLFQVGDFFEMYGEDARTAARLLDFNLSSRSFPGIGRLDTCSVPSHQLDFYLETLRDTQDAVVASIATLDGSREIREVLSVDHEAERALDAHEAEDGADGYRAFPGNSPEAEAAASDQDTSHVPPTIPLTQADIDDQLRTMFPDAEAKRAIVRYMGEHGRERETAAWLADQYYHTDVTSPLHISRGEQETTLSWPKVQRRIAQLIQADQFFTPEEYDRLDDVDPAEVRGHLAQAGIVNGEVADPEALAQDPFIQQVQADAEQISWPEPEDQPEITSEPVAVYPSEQTNLPYDVVIERLHIEEPEHDPPTPEPDSDAAFAAENMIPGETTFSLDGRTYLIDRVDLEHGVVNYQDISFVPPANGDLFHTEPISVVRWYLEAERTVQAQEEHPAESILTAESGANASILTGESSSEGTDTLDAEKSSQEPEKAYKVGDSVWLDNTEYQITEIGMFDVQLRDPALPFPVFRSESIERFEPALKQDTRNGHITEFLAASLQMGDMDLQDVLTGEDGLLNQHNKDIVSGWFRAGFGNTRAAELLAETYAGFSDTMLLGTGDGADYICSTTGIEIHVADKYDTTMEFTWQEVAEMLRAMYQADRYGFHREPVDRTPVTLEGVPTYAVGDSVVIPFPERDVEGTIQYIGDTDVRVDSGPYSWSGEVVNREQFEEIIRHDARNAHLFTPEDRIPAAENFRITDTHLGEGGPKAKFRANMEAIYTLKTIENEGRTATAAEQETLSRYVGWGGLADAFDPDKREWSGEYKELEAALTPEEYAAARSSTLNAHYTSPTVIKAMYDALGNMGFTSGNILEPSMGVGNFFGMLPDDMSGSKLYGVELDSITGRIAQQLYPNANITVAGFETTDRRDFYDVAIGNVPFGQYQVDDRAYNKLGFSIHNYFFAKALDQVRPGGVVAFVTSRYTMDAKNSAARKYIAQRADLLGAIRLPNNVFRANAGTDVVSDIIFLQKRDQPRDVEPDWGHLGENEDGFAINSYFVEHPEMILGRQSSTSTQYGNQDFTVEPIEGLELADQLEDAIKYIRGTYQAVELPELSEGEDIADTIPADPDVRNYPYTVVDGEVYFRENSVMVRPELNATAKERVKGMVALRDCVHELIDLQMDAYTTDSEIQAKQQELNNLYDTYTAKYGLINDRANKLAFSDDSSYYLLCSLEVLDQDRKLERKADMFTKRTIQQARPVDHVDTAVEALAVSIGEKALVDISYMAELSGKTPEEITTELRGVIFKDPASTDDPLSGWQTADEYLSGNVRRKLRQAQRAAERDPAFQINVEALEKAQPKDLDASEIEVRLGATWIDKRYIQQFMEETFDTPYYLRYRIQVNYSPFTAEWQITNKSAVGYGNIAANTTYGTDRANAYRLLEDALNLRDIRIYDTVEDADGKERRVLNGKETTLAAQKQQLIREAFKDWIWKDPQRRETLVRQYNEEMNSTRPREYDGSHLVFSGMNPEITLREHQKNAIAHVIYGGNTLLAHEVGAGKTFEMVAAAMESKRLGLCSKSLFVVPNHLTDQWASEFLRLYPSANILVTTKKDFEPHNRKKFCARIATGDYDAVIIGHSQFEKIPISQERQRRLLEDQIDEITEGIAEVKENNGERFTIKQLEKTKKSLEARLKKLLDSPKDDVVTFEQLGVDRMFVDESDNYKNLFLYTKMRNVAGLSTTDAQKSSDMFMKCRYMDEKTGGRGNIFATGTPISNSMTELYTIQRYLQYDRLQELGMGHFDCWASRFGETVSALELAPEGTGYRMRTRFAKFFNLPELMNLFKEVADIKTADQLNLPTPEVEYHTYASKPTAIQQEMVQSLSERASQVHSGSVDPTEDNMLKITSDGRKLGLDQRILNPMLPDEEGTKVNQCVDNILQYWRDGEDQKLTQLVFCDISTPKGKTATEKVAAKAPSGALDSPEIHALESAIPLEESTERPFTIYEDIRQKLMAGGMPSEQIAFIHDADTEVKKSQLFAKVRAGEVRVLLGSTAKMGAGTNVQDRLIALHDLDCPWRPRDLIQRKGRIERQGNQNPLVHVCRYVTEGTFDSYLWQTVENKQKFISQIMTSKSPVRACDDVDETALSFAEIKALCAGDPRIKERMDLDVDVSKLKIMKADHQSKQYRLEDNLLKLYPQQIEENKGFIRGLEADMKTLAAHPVPEEGFAGMEIRGDLLTDKENAGAALLDAIKEVKNIDPVEIGSYRGFKMEASFDVFQQKYILTLRGEMTHQTELGSDPKGNLTRIENTLEKMPARLKGAQAQLENVYAHQAAAQEEVGKPFPYEQELATKSARLIELDTQLDLDGRSRRAPEQVVAKSKPSVLAKLKEDSEQTASAPKKDRKPNLGYSL